MRPIAKFATGFLALAALAAIWFSVRDVRVPQRAATPTMAAGVEHPAPLPEINQRSNVVAPKRQVDPTRAAVSSVASPPEEGRSPLADELYAANRSGMEDLAVVLNLFTHYRSRFQGYPVGEDNATFVNALSGNNPGRLAFIRRDHPAIDAQGQLLDRWGEPFFFHLVERDSLEIRSAGPDRELYTQDDLLTASPTLQNAKLAGE
jgi:hypothetical protein